jgi:hypothetical protein
MQKRTRRLLQKMFLGCMLEICRFLKTMDIELGQDRTLRPLAEEQTQLRLDLETKFKRNLF